MTEIGLELDETGLAAPPRANGELVFEEPWQRRLFATTMALCEADVITYDAFRERLIVAIAAGDQPYWSSWQDALEHQLADAAIATEEDLADRAAAYRSHG